MSALFNQLARSVLLFDDVVRAIFADNVQPPRETEFAFVNGTLDALTVVLG